MGYCAGCGGWDKKQGGSGHRFGCKIAESGTPIDQPLVEVFIRPKRWWQIRCTFNPGTGSFGPPVQVVFETLKKGAPEGKIISFDPDPPHPHVAPYLTMVGPMRYSSLGGFRKSFQVKSGKDVDPSPETLSLVDYDSSFEQDVEAEFKKKYAIA